MADAALVARAHQDRVPIAAPGIDRDLDKICLRALSRSRDLRHHSASELASNLEHWLRRADSRAACTAGNNKAINTPIMAMTTNSSISVKPDREPRRSIGQNPH